MILEEIKQLRTGARELRKFGLTVGGIFLLLGLWFYLRGKARYPYFLAPGAVLFILGAAVPRLLKSIYIGWMTLASVFGWIVSTTLLALFYYLVVTPIGLLARLAGKDFLHRRFVRQASSYWIRRNRAARKELRDYSRQF